jgi:hypothetical protein
LEGRKVWKIKVDESEKDEIRWNLGVSPVGGKTIEFKSGGRKPACRIPRKAFHRLIKKKTSLTLASGVEGARVAAS